jgi:hypothetical protein
VHKIEQLIVKKVGIFFSAYLLILIAVNYFSSHSLTDAQNAFIYGEAYRVGSIYNHISSYLNQQSPAAVLQAFDAFILSSLELNFISKGYNQQILYFQLFLWTLILNYSNFRNFSSNRLISFVIAGFVTFNPITYRFLLSNNPYILSIILCSAAFINLLLDSSKKNIEILVKTVGCVLLTLVLGVNAPLLITFTIFLMLASIYIKKNKTIFFLSLFTLIIYTGYLIYCYIGNDYTEKILKNNAYFLNVIYNNLSAANIISLPFLVSQSGTENLFGIETYFRYIGFIPILLSIYFLQVLLKNKKLFFANVAFNIPLIIGGTLLAPMVLLLINSFPFILFKSAPEKFTYLSLLFFSLSIAKINSKITFNITSKFIIFATFLYVTLVTFFTFSTILGLNIQTVNNRFEKVPVSYFHKFREYDLNIVKCKGAFMPTTTNIYNLVVADFPIDFTTNSTNFVPEYFKSVNYVDSLSLISEVDNQYVVIENTCNGVISPEFTLLTNGNIYEFFKKN